MLKSIKALVLVAILGTAAIVVPMQEGAAQPKKKEMEKAEGVVQIKTGKDGKFRFTVRNAEGKLLAQSSLSGFKTEEEAKAGIDALKTTLESAKVETVKD